MAVAGQPSLGRLESSSSEPYERYRSIPKRVETVFLRGLNGTALRALRRIGKQIILPATYESLCGAIDLRRLVSAMRVIIAAAAARVMEEFGVKVPTESLPVRIPAR